MQTFGHVEVGGRSPAPHPASCGGFPLEPPLMAPLMQFILKHEKYQHLREIERFPNSFNPHVPDTLALLKSILSQVIEKHRRSTWIHIGADEVGSGHAGTPALVLDTKGAPRGAEHPPAPQIQVFHLGEGMDSKNWMSRNKGDTGTMFLNHIKEVLGFIATQYRGLRALMWDDMLRKISVGALRGERMGTAAVAPEPGASAAPICLAALAGVVPGARQLPMPGPMGT